MKPVGEVDSTGEVTENEEETAPPQLSSRLSAGPASTAAAIAARTISAPRHSGAAGKKPEGAGA